MTDETGYPAPGDMLVVTGENARVERIQTQKKDAGKPRMELLDPLALTQLAEVLTFGAQKYEADGWRKGIEWSRTVGALLRHTTKFMSGETYDEETGLHHMAHVMCNAMFLVNWATTHPELDDRPVIKTPWVCEENGVG